jgi:hypothetical protein
MREHHGLLVPARPSRTPHPVLRDLAVEEFLSLLAAEERVAALLLRFRYGRGEFTVSASRPPALPTPTL